MTGSVRSPLLLLITVFLTGSCVMSVEMSASRLLQPYYGSSVYIWTNIIAVILTGLSIGYWVGGRAAERFPHPKVLSSLILVAGILVLLIPPLSGPVQRFFLPAFGDLPARGAHDSVVGGSLASTVVLFVLPVLLLGAIPPFAVKLLTVHGRPPGAAAGSILMISTLGSIFGTFLPAHLTIPLWGTRATYLGSGAVLLLLGTFGIARPIIAPLVLLLPATIAFFLQGLPIRPTEGSIEELESAYQYINVIETPGEAELPRSVALTLDEGINDFQSLLVDGQPLTDGKYFDYYALLPCLLEKTQNLDVLILGAGANTIARSLIAIYPSDRFASIDSIEIDPKIVEVGRKHFDADFDRRGPVTNHVFDGRVFLECSSKNYDYIVVDAYSNQLYIPFHFATEEFFQLVRSRLKPGGIFAMNVSCFGTTSPLFASLGRTVTSVFPVAYRSPIVGGGWNQMIFAFGDSRPTPFADLTVAQIPPPLAVHFCKARDVTVRLAGEANPDALILTDDRAPVAKFMDLELNRAPEATLPSDDRPQQKPEPDRSKGNTERALALFSRFEREWLEYKRDSAFEAFKEAFQLDPTIRDFPSYAYGTFLKCGEISKILQFYQAAAERTPDSPSASYYAGWTHFEVGDVQNAVRSLERVAILDPFAEEFPDLQANLGFFYLALGQIDKAEESYRKVAAQAPGHSDAVTALAQIEVLRKARPRQAVALTVFCIVLGLLIWMVARKTHDRREQPTSP